MRDDWLEVGPSEDIFTVRDGLADDLAELLVKHGFEIVVPHDENEPVASFKIGGVYFDVMLRVFG